MASIPQEQYVEIQYAGQEIDPLASKLSVLERRFDAHIGKGGNVHASATQQEAGFMSPDDKIKLDGVETGATQNSTDAFLLNRGNHTGQQAIESVTGLRQELDDALAGGSNYRGLFPSLAALEAAIPVAVAGNYADVDEGEGINAIRYIWDDSDQSWVSGGAGEPLTAPQVKALYESNPNTNALTDIRLNKLNISILAVDNITALRGVIGQFNGQVVFLRCHTNADYGSGHFEWQESSTSADDNGLVVAPSSAASGRWRRVISDGVVLAEWWGMVPGSLASQNAPARSALAYASSIGGGVVRFVPGDVWLEVDVDFGVWKVALSVASGCWVDLRGTRIRLLGTSANMYKIFLFDRGVNIAGIFGGAIVGDRASHIGTTGEHGMGISIYGAKGIYVRDMNISDCWGDGVYVGANTGAYPLSASENISISGVVCDNNRRQGLSVVSVKKLFVSESRFINTNGTAPQCGIDIEPNASGVIEGVFIDKVDCSGNVGDGVLTTKNPAAAMLKDVRVGALTVGNNGRFGAQFSSIAGLTIESVRAFSNGLVGFGVQGCEDVSIGSVECSGHSVTASGVGVIELRNVANMSIGKIASNSDTARHAVQAAGCIELIIGTIRLTNVNTTMPAVYVSGATDTITIDNLIVRGSNREVFEALATATGVVLKSGNMLDVCKGNSTPVVINRSESAIISGMRIRKGAGIPLHGIRNYSNGCLIYGNRLAAADFTGLPISDTGAGGSQAANLLT